MLALCLRKHKTQDHGEIGPPWVRLWLALGLVRPWHMSVVQASTVTCQDLQGLLWPGWVLRQLSKVTSRLPAEEASEVHG